jgi:DNA primase
MALLDLIPNLKRIGTTHGGEYAGPCPFCGGNDRFRVWPDQGTTGRFWCRGCGKTGDGIQFIRDKDGLSYRDACATLGVNPSLTWKPGQRSGQATWTPREATTPGDAWADRAGAFLETCQKNLAGSSGADCRSFLTGRGLHPGTIKAAGLGWNTRDVYADREAWGLSPETKEDGKPRRVWLPVGLVIPHLVAGHVHRLRVRRPDPGEGPRYVIIPGSGAAPLTLGTGAAWVVVESELCALLLAQEAGDLAGVLSMGNAQARPDAETHQALKEAGLILIALDSDQAGAREAWQWWAKHYPTAKRWPCPISKDPTEAKQAGLDLRSWIRAGLPTEPAQEPLQATNAEKTYKNQESEPRTVFEPFPEGWKERFGIETLERLAILTVDAGLTDLEALTEVISQC